MGEEARRTGLDFERSIAAMLTQLGYEIVLENESLQCQVQAHTKRSHGIDFLAKPTNPELSRPLASPNGLTVFSCKHAQIGDSDIRDLDEAFECVKLHSKYQDISGAVLVTSAWVQRELQEKFSRSKGMYLWDQPKCHLYGNLARYYARIQGNVGTRSRNRIYAIPRANTIVTLTLTQTQVGYLSLFDYNELGIFYDGNARFNVSNLEEILAELRKARIVPRFTLNRIIIHTTKGVTADFPAKIDETVSKFIGRTVGLACLTADLYDHSNPWFPTYIW